METFCFSSALRLRALAQHGGQHLGDFLHPRTHPRLGQPWLRREGQVVEHRHGVVHHRELEHLGDVALLRVSVDRFAVEQHLAMGRREQPGDDVEQGRLAAARRPEQGIGAALLPHMLQLAQGVVVGAGGRRL
jgi:hypothetical protein